MCRIRSRSRAAPRLTPIIILFISILISPAHAGGTTEDAGDILSWALPLLAAGVTLSQDDQEGLVQLGLSFGTTLGATYGLKKLIDSERPDGRDNDSFPSGHTSRSFSSAAYLDHRYGWRYGLPAYAIASYVAYSRVEADAHHVRDVASGAVLAWGVSHFFVDPKSNITVQGEVSERRALLRLGFQW